MAWRLCYSYTWYWYTISIYLYIYISIIYHISYIIYHISCIIYHNNIMLLQFESLPVLCIPIIFYEPLVINFDHTLCRIFTHRHVKICATDRPFDTNHRSTPQVLSNFLSVRPKDKKQPKFRTKQQKSWCKAYHGERRSKISSKWTKHGCAILVANYWVNLMVAHGVFYLFIGFLSRRF